MRLQLITAVLGLALATSLGACSSSSARCESLCTQLVDECGYSAWTSVDQCRSGCVDDMYRRSDADEVLGCYEEALAVPSREEAATRVNRARQAGLFDRAVENGTWDEEAEIDRAIDLGTCDLFSFVQCKVEAVQATPESPLLP